MSDTLGSLVDKLSIVNVKLFMCQDRVFEAEKTQSGLDAETVASLTALNRQRNKLMSEIDRAFADGVFEKRVAVEERIKLE